MEDKWGGLGKGLWLRTIVGSCSILAERVGSKVGPGVMTTPPHYDNGSGRSVHNGTRSIQLRHSDISSSESESRFFKCSQEDPLWDVCRQSVLWKPADLRAPHSGGDPGLHPQHRYQFLVGIEQKPLLAGSSLPCL